MPITVSWDDDAHTITRVEFYGLFNFDDILDAWTEELSLVHSVAYDVYSLNVFNVIAPSVRGFNTAKLRKFSENIDAPNLKLTVQVSENSMLRGALGFLPMPMPHPRKIVASLDEAYALINAAKLQ